jgi:hypothetical protein
MAPKDSPSIYPTGIMIIPFNADPKYHHWNGGQSLTDILTELNIAKDIWDKHTVKPYPGNTA